MTSSELGPPYAVPRASPRAVVEIPVDCEMGAEHRSARSIDLSVTGLRLQMSAPAPPVGSLLRVGFDLPGRTAHVEALGRTIWIEVGQAMPRLGLRFERFLAGYVELGDFLVQQLGDSGAQA
jgi:PilZ domain